MEIMDVSILMVMVTEILMTVSHLKALNGKILMVMGMEITPMDHNLILVNIYLEIRGLTNMVAQIVIMMVILTITMTFRMMF